ncbi:uncharacterized protein PgNI_03572, partial [Pyricularia grisea]|uniref:Uncharacterized protein n=1 Tax=Pyricularia grisea TaxID=148305 RepID=A0A6P8BB46_PYRGI
MPSSSLAVDRPTCLHNGFLHTTNTTSRQSIRPLHVRARLRRIASTSLSLLLASSR